MVQQAKRFPECLHINSASVFHLLCSPKVSPFPTVSGNESSWFSYNQTAAPQTPEGVQNGTAGIPDEGTSFASAGAAAPGVGLGLPPPPERSTPATRLSACMLLPASPDPKAGKQSQGCVYARLTYGTPMDHLQHSNVPRQGLKIYMSTTQAHVVWRA